MHAMHDESKLPKWAQQELNSLRRDINALEKAHAVLADGHKWFILGSHGGLNLFTCSRDGTQLVASLEDGDKMLIGRAKSAET